MDVGIPCRYLTPDLAGIGGEIKRELEDFVVEEVPLYTPSGTGEHTYFAVEKRDLSTLEALERLGKALGRDPKDFGYAGLKDRKSVSRQVFSLAGVDPNAVLQLDLPQIRVLWAEQHSNKLRVGHLKGNRFRIRVRGVHPAASERIPPILERVRRLGLPNYFGPQRFGTRADSQWIGKALLEGDDRAGIRRLLGMPSRLEKNPDVVRARWLFEQYRWHEALRSYPSGYREERNLLRYLLRAGENYRGARKRLRPAAKKLFFTAYQAYLFNRVLDLRLERSGGDPGKFFHGDIAFLHRNGACFRVERPEELEERARAFEVSPSGPLFGLKMLRPEGEPGRVEEAVLAEEGLRIEAFHALRPRMRLEGGRRPLRVAVEDLTWGLEDGNLVLEFFLRKGSYATTFLRELMKSEKDLTGPATSLSFAS